MDFPKVSRINGRFVDASLETAYFEDAWPGLRLQAGLTLIGFSLAWLLSLATDFTYLRGTDYFLLVAGMRNVTGVFGVLAGAWLLLRRPPAEAWSPHVAVNVWATLSALTGLVVASVYPLTEPTPAGQSDILVFTSYWMSLQILGLGAALAFWVPAVSVMAAVYATTYLGLAVYWSPILPQPLIGTSILMIASCLFAVILASVFSNRGRRRYYIMRLYEQAKDSAEKAQEFSAFLLAATGHDIRQPIYALDLNASMLEELIEAENWDRVRALAKRQRQVSRNVASLLSSVLELSYLDTDKRQVEPRAIDIDTLVADIVESMQDVAAEKGITIRQVESGLTLNADPGIIEHILANLLTNALNHSGGTRIQLEVCDQADRAEIRVADDGRGIGQTPLTIDAERLHPNTGRSGRRGLGLEIMFRLAERGGLDLSITSEPGVGVTARLAAPQAGPG